MAKILQIEGQSIEVTLKSLEQMQTIVGGNVEFIVKGDIVMIINERPKRMKLNKQASEILSINVYGNTILCNKDEIY